MFSRTSTTPSLKKSLEQLSAASAALASSSISGGIGDVNGSAAYAAEASAYRLLAREGGGFDAARLGKSMRELEHNLSQYRGPSSSVEGPSAASAPADFESFMQHSLQNMIQTTLGHNKERAIESSNIVVNKRLEEIYEQEKKQWFAELAGYRVVSKPSQPTPLPTFQQPPMATTTGSVFSSTSLEEVPKRHAALVCKLNAMEEASPSSAAQVYLSELDTLAKDFAQLHTRLSSEAEHSGAYLNALALIRFFINQKSSSSMNRALAALEHLANEFQSHISQRVRESFRAGRISETNTSTLSSTAQDVAWYVESTMGIVGSASTLLWPRIYYCLRCGNATAALETIQSKSRSGGQSQVEPCVCEIISHLTSYQKQSNFVFRQVSERTISIPAHLQKELGELYQRTASRTQQASNEHAFKLATLALLCNDGEQSADSSVVETIEDYLFTFLWVAVSSDAPSQQLIQIAKLLQQWGPKYFESDDHGSSGGWAYAMPLMIAQQLETALTHLATVGGALGLLQATHIGILLDAYKIPLADLGQSPSTSNNKLLSSLLSSHCESIKAADPAAALEYLVRIPDEALMRTHIQQLIVSTRAYDILAGSLSPTGVRDFHVPPTSAVAGQRRDGAALDAHFSATQIAALLNGAAQMALKDGMVEDAAEILALAGSYGDLLALFNSRLGELMVPRDDTEFIRKRKFWYDAAKNFHSAYLDGVNGSRLLDALDNCGATPVVQTFTVLMNLLVFFDHYKANQWEEAAYLIDRLSLLPNTQQEMASKISAYHQMDHALKQNVAQITLAFMDCLYQMFSAFNAQLHTLKPTNAEFSTLSQKLADLKVRSKLVSNFARLIPTAGPSNEINTQLARMEAHMV